MLEQPVLVAQTCNPASGGRGKRTTSSRPGRVKERAQDWTGKLNEVLSQILKQTRNSRSVAPR